MPKKPSSKPAKPAKVPVHGPQHANQVRIIGGQWKRTPLPVLSALGLRPTPDRVRETAFNWINHQRDANWANAQVLDLFAGSGALGFEAASRGAQSVTMIDSNAQVTRQLEEIKLKLKAENVQIMRGDALSVAQSAAARGQRYDLIFLDPPYQQSLLEKTLPLCSKLLKEGGLVYAESGLALEFAEGETPEWLADWEIIRADKAGMVFYHLLKYKS
ncbi:16S rRNA (guanine(966)-N(2))-methyltransferase RsmD [Duganella levis]|jgi:16S rRNA (guanine(966)-N(2))-methyltransferase RsmD|uniref:16S rRNA (Guanine(966)-N(2))-methyltransferase RsmD n=1 Tax=Duganella levis TaxID=2692169 RepID=A0ABW9W1A8_9BURK|nr:16S rRNA (guanine(966)-N(2))-methyltransferase RsmD [Duganella levis]MYN27723.1 16S rRNA (guanine(966)-N(2))-methyltransferase RsmD [Duganella levis]